MTPASQNIVTDVELANRCEWVGKRTARLLRETGKHVLEFYFGKGDGSLLWRQQAPDLAPLMNSGSTKEVLWSMIRLLIKDAGYDCFIYASDMWCFQGNARYQALTEARRYEIQDAGFKRAVREGLWERA